MLLFTLYLPPLKGDGHDGEDAGRIGEVAEALKQWEKEVNKGVAEHKVDGEYEEVGDEEEGVGGTETGKEMVEDTVHGLPCENEKADHIARQPKA